MVQFNLLPAVKLEYIKAVRTKRVVTTIAGFVSVGSLLILALLFINVNFIQAQHINNLTEDIDNKVNELEQIEDIDKVLTVQNQLNSLTALHESKPATDRVLPYLSKVTPTAASIAQSTVNFTTNTMTISGSASSLVVVNEFVDTLKFTEFTVDGNTEQTPAFSNVVLKSFSVTNSEATYQIEFSFNPIIFDNTKKVDLVVPNIVSTRSQTEKPSDLFRAPPANEQTGQGQ